MKSPSSTQTIVLAVDGSEHAYAATQMVRALPLPADCQIRVITVLLPRYAQQFSILEQVLTHTQDLLAENLPNPVHTELLTGDPAEEIATYAKRERANLIVMGALGLRSALGISLGGVAQNVVEGAPCPVLVTRAPFKGLRRVLFATDGSESSRFALRHLRDCPLPEDAAVQVIHVLPPQLTADAIGQSWMFSMEMTAPVITETLQEELEQKAAAEQENGEQIIAEAIAGLEEQGLAADGVLRRGDAADEIIHYAREIEADLIIVGSRGLGTFRSLLLGSVSRKLVHYAERSVLVVRQTAERGSP